MAAPRLLRFAGDLCLMSLGVLDQDGDSRKENEESRIAGKDSIPIPAFLLS
jgi:hypothetical protein